MSRCQSCGNIFSNPSAKFCNECGHDNSWSATELDRKEQVHKYVMALHQIYFDVESTSDSIDQFSMSLRQRFKISFERHEKVFMAFEDKKRTLASMLALELEFDENVQDAYAGEDTYLRFKVSSPAGGSEMFKIALDWDDPETPDEMDFRATSPGLIKPGQQLEIGGTHVFVRAGPKEISDLLMTVENQFFEKEVFKVSPFRFKVAKASDHVVNNITTHNQISIEGRGVVDASGAGGNIKTGHPQDHAPRWRKLSFSLELDSSLIDTLVSKESNQDNDTDLVSAAPSVIAEREHTEHRDEAPHAVSEPEVIEPTIIDSVVPESITKNATLTNEAPFKEEGKEAKGETHVSPQTKVVAQVVFNDGGASFLAKNGVTEPQILTYANGDVYFGQVLEGQMQGKGVYTFSPQGEWAGQRYEGDFWADQFHGLGTIYYPDGAVEYCVYRNNKKLGQQEHYEYSNGDTYIGTMKEGLPHGAGLYRWVEGGPSYFGAMKNSLLHGLGHYFWDDGTTRAMVLYAGQPIDDQREFRFDNGDTYLGTLKNGTPHGFGEYHFSGEYAGHIIFGPFRNGVMHGLMDSYYPDGTFKETVYINGSYAGEQETIHYENGDQFIGVVVNGIPEHYGKYVFALNGPNSGHVYLGEFKTGLFHGEGEYTIGDETTVGLWEQGNFIQSKTVAIIKEHAAQITSEKFYHLAKLPAKKLSNIRSSYLQGLSTGEEIVYVYDDTLFGSAKDGTTFTTQGIYSHETGENGWHVPYSQLNTIVQNKKNILLNGTRTIKIIMAEQYESNVIFNMLLAIQHHYQNDLK